MPLTTFNIKAVHHLGKMTESRGFYVIQAPTRGDAIIEAQKKMAAQWGLSRTEEALVRVEFVS